MSRRRDPHGADPLMQAGYSRGFMDDAADELEHLEREAERQALAERMHERHMQESMTSDQRRALRAYETAPDALHADGSTERTPIERGGLVGQNGGFAVSNRGSGRMVVLRSADRYTPRPIEWLEDQRIALGKLTLIAGDPGLGKSFLTLDLCAKVSRGLLPESSRPGRALILSAEDDPADTIRPRLDAMVADPSRVHIMEGIVEGGGRVCTPARLDEHMRLLAHAARSLDDLRLIVIDPISAYMGKTDSHNNADVRRVLAELSRLAESTRAAVVCVTHLNKDQGNQKKAIYCAMGSLAFTAAARMVFSVSKHPDDDTKRVVCTVKSNIARPTASRVFRVQHNEHGASFEWLDETCDFDADTVECDDTHEHRSAIDEAEDFLRELLKDGPVPAREGLKQAEKAGVSEYALRRARRSLGITLSCEKPGPGAEYKWGFPEDSVDQG